MIDIRRQHSLCHPPPAGLYRKASLLHWALLSAQHGSLMGLLASLLCSFALALPLYAKPAAFEAPNSPNILCACNDIAAAISGASQVFFPRTSLSHLRHFILILMRNQATPQYLLDISHAASSSSQTSICSVEPGTAEDVGKIVSYRGLTHQLLSIHNSVATYSRIESNSLCRERWRTHHEPRIFLDWRGRDRDDTLQRDKGQFLVWNS